MTKKGRHRPHQTSKRSGKHWDSKENSKSASDWIWGLHAAHHAIGNKIRKVERIVATAKVARELGLTPCGIDVMEAREIDSLLPSGAVHQGLAVKTAPLPQPSLDELLAQHQDAGNSCLIVLDQVEDPHNVGAIMRTAAAFGALGLVVQDRHAPQITGTLAKTASGAVEYLPLVRVTNLSRALGQIAEAGYFRIGLAGEAEQTLSQIASSPKTALVLGAEGTGLRRLTRENCDLLARLPTAGPIASINVSNAAAVAMYEVNRTDKP